MQFSLMYPMALVLLLLLPCFVWCKLKAEILYFSKPEWLPKQSFAWDNLTLWLMAIYSLLVIALAHPFSYEAEAANQKRGGIWYWYWIPAVRWRSGGLILITVN